MSPYNLIQEHQIGKPYEAWRIIVCCSLLNRTHGRQVRTMFEDLFDVYPNPYAMMEAAKNQSAYIMSVLTPLGQVNRRTKALADLCEDYLVHEKYKNHERHADWNPRASAEWVRGIRGCGQYTVDSVNIFCNGILENPSSDTWLQKYVDWRKQNAC